MTNLSVECNVCSGRNFKIIQESRMSYEILECLNCGLVFVNPQPQSTDLCSHYGNNYFEPWTHPKIKNRREKIFKKRWEKVKSYVKQKGTLLDIGCGCGEFLYFAKEDGWSVYGTEISNFSSNYISKMYRIDTISIGNLEDISYPSGFFDVITIWHVLEHLTNPRRTLEEVSRIIKKNGLLVIAVPNFKSYIYKFIYKIIKGKDVEIFEPDMRELHLYHFNQSNIKILLNRVGFEIINETVDLGMTDFRFKLLNILALFIFNLTRLNYGTAIEIIARKL
jgi:2-polyprenyl-3-methyl-5-hydroxy-6-metoxy-1,4-benzoquinol methylase